ncbi:hypothetical protein GGR57DRAFT_43672 [Xylariaceae sp. FL1272]|nr:hypothetical protein GGR57DRAFT_43672 [Xylariaceae sp. FL1272]
MVQRKLTYYFTAISTEPEVSSSLGHLSFLHLPYRVRYRIYVLAGLVRFCPISFNHEGPRSRMCMGPGLEDELVDYPCFYEARRLHPLDTVDCFPGCHCPPLPSSLLCLSRRISDEVLRILYSQNSSTISRIEAWGLKPILNLHPSSLRYIRILTIHLNACQCFYAQPFDFLDCHEDPSSHPIFTCHASCQEYGAHDQPLRRTTRHLEAILQEWNVIVCRLVKYCRLESMRLDLVCDTADIETAEHFIDSLSPIRPLIASIRLSRDPSWKHSLLAQRAVSALIGQKRQEAPRNMSKTYYLPPEILEHILSYSQLVAPFDLEWCTDRGLVPFDCCSSCTATLTYCLCSHHHGFSPSCTCWRLPLHLFLVSRQVNHIAKIMFYQRNRFIILTTDNRLGGHIYSLGIDCPPIIDFFRRLPPDATFRIRSLGLVFPFPKCGRSLESATFFSKWDKTIELLLAKCNIRKLSLSLFIGQDETRYRQVSELPIDPTYKALTTRLKSMCDLNALFIYLQWPDWTKVKATLRYSAALEKEILGPKYDSGTKGKWTNMPQLCGTRRYGREYAMFAMDVWEIWPKLNDEDAYGPPVYQDTSQLYSYV